MTLPETDAVRAFAFGFLHIAGDRQPRDFRPRDRLYEKWRPTVMKALDLARAAYCTTPADQLAALVARQLCAWALSSDELWQQPDIPANADLETWLSARWTPAVNAMLEAARRARAAEQGMAAA